MREVHSVQVLENGPIVNTTVKCQYTISTKSCLTSYSFFLGQENSTVSKKSFAVLSWSRCLAGKGLQNQSPKHTLIDYMLHFKGIVLTQEKAYLFPHSLSPVFLMFLNDLWSSLSIMRGWLLEGERMLRRRREKEQEGESIIGFRKLSAWLKCTDHYNSNEVCILQWKQKKKKSCWLRDVDLNVISYLYSSQLDKNIES